MRLVLIAAAGLAAIAQPLPLSLHQAVEIALAPDGNTRLRLAREAAELAKARQAQARASLLPNVDASMTGLNFTRNLRAFGISFPPVPGFQPADIVGPITNFDARVTAGVTVFDFSAWKRVDTARTLTAAAQAEAEAARNAASEQVARAYVAALRAGAALDAAKANIVMAESLLRLTTRQKDAGTGTGIEVVRSEVQLANERQRLLLLENDARKTTLGLARLLNLELDKEIVLTDSLVMPETDPPGLAEALLAARSTRKDLSAQALREQAARRSYEAVKWERLPSVQAFADYGTIGLDVESARATRTFGATLRIPIFDGGRRDARRAEAGVLLRQDQIRTEDLKKQIELDVRLAHDAMSASSKQVAVADEGVALAARELEQARRRYENGVTASLEVVDAQTRLERARDNHVLALYQYNQARIELASAMGSIHRILQ
ncbi:MAG: TolC family protein [Acidobacteria bacterium]|nr:TolC family protein [Acidobacteriota bacterium]